MQSLSSSYTNSISVLGFPKQKTLESALTEESSFHRLSPAPLKCMVDPMDIDGEYQTKHEIDCNSTVDTSASSSMGDSMEVHRRPTERVPKTIVRKHTRRRKLAVRFAPETCLEPKRARKMRKRKTMGDGSSPLTCDPERWYTRTELKSIQNSCVSDLFMRHSMSTMNSIAKGMEFPDDPILDRFSDRNRKRRKLARWKMYETTRVLKEFENVTGKKTAPEFLSQLLRRHSKPMKMDAVELALKMRMAKEVSDQVPSLLIPAKSGTSVPSRSTNRLQLSSEEKHATLTYARMILHGSHMAEQQHQMCVPSPQYH